MNTTNNTPPPVEQAPTPPLPSEPVTEAVAPTGPDAFLLDDDGSDFFAAPT